MYNDIEEVIADNLSIKKAYYLSKHQIDKIQQDLLSLKEENKHLTLKNQDLAQTNIQLTQKNKRLQLDIANDTSTFTSQIEEMKYLIEQKEEELANFQLKMIPSLDQDMLRVKIIAEMEGPYQETVDKKDREIAKLKDHLHQLKRDKQILDFSLKNKEREAKNEIQDMKAFYEGENERMSRQMAHITSKQKGGKFEKDLIKNYKKQIDQLRATTDCQKDLQAELRRQNAILRQEKSKLMEDIANANSRRALQIHQSSHQGETKALKKEVHRLEDQLSKIQDANERLERKIKTMEGEKLKNVTEFEHQLKSTRYEWEKQKQRLTNESLDNREEIRRLKDIKNRQEEDYLAICEKFKNLQILHDATVEQNRSLKLKISLTDQQFETSRYRKSEDEKLIRQKLEKQLRIRIEKEIREELRIEFGGRRGGSQNESPNKDDDFKKTSKTQEKIRKLEQKNRKLSEKLEFANRKIVELLREKAQRQQSQRPISHESPRRGSPCKMSPQHSYHRLLLENRDCSFIPLVPPVIFEDLHCPRQF